MIWNVRLKCFSVFSLKNRLYQDFGFKYTPDWTIWSSKFQKFSGEGLTEPPPQTPPPALSRASPSVRASPDSDPPNFWSVAAPLSAVRSLLAALIRVRFHINKSEPPPNNHLVSSLVVHHLRWTAVQYHLCWTTLCRYKRDEKYQTTEC